MTFSLLVLHMWLCLRRLKQEGKEGVEFGQYIYEIYNHDVELRVSKAGVQCLFNLHFILYHCIVNVILLPGRIIVLLAISLNFQKFHVENMSK